MHRLVVIYYRDRKYRVKFKLNQCL